ncbi:LytR/AlgR family response regulator transcription factor [Chitinophaga barathri]|uniref:DNA-binding response regulator n=1 Tax=Chitinophaga barathri TaxID=1647451 RepID=A0A3N4MTJ3_9BACT|nr:LytTR family DNA-binding domain-containing protein [Chitinophaga barathri]RPD38743.1 DNA-binding response regulator [Chitinophaga barathri]
MQKIRCIAIDDELLALDVMEDYIRKIPFLELCGTYQHVLEALPAIERGEVELVFLDIQMPQLTGLQFMRLIHGKARAILTTAYSQYAVDSYEHEAIDYLMKPIAFDRFYKSAQKALALIRPQQSEFPQEKAPTEIPPFIFVKTDSKMVKVMLSEIRYVEGLKDYVAIHTLTDTIITLQNMKRMESILPLPHFARVHKSYLVALEKIDSIERNRLFVGPDVIPVGDTYREAFFQLIEHGR